MKFSLYMTSCFSQSLYYFVLWFLFGTIQYFLYLLKFSLLFSGLWRVSLWLLFWTLYQVNHKFYYIRVSFWRFILFLCLEHVSSFYLTLCVGVCLHPEQCGHISCFSWIGLVQEKTPPPITLDKDSGKFSNLHASPTWVFLFFSPQLSRVCWVLSGHQNKWDGSQVFGSSAGKLDQWMF